MRSYSAVSIPSLVNKLIIVISIPLVAWLDYYMSLTQSPLFAFFIRVALFTLAMTLMWGYRQSNGNLDEETYRDPHTGAFNYRAFIEFSEREVLKANRTKSSLVLIYFDMDQFKRVNNQFGRSVGDQVLIDFTSIAMQNIRCFDIFARIGDDEFVALLVDVNLEHAVSILDRIKSSFKQKMESEEIYLTVSAGVMTISEQTQTLAETIEQTSQLMCQAKSVGNGRVFSFQPA